MSVLQSLKRVSKHEFTYSTFYKICQGFALTSVVMYNGLNFERNTRRIAKLCPEAERSHIVSGLIACTVSKGLVCGYMGPVFLAYLVSMNAKDPMVFSPGSSFILWKERQK